MTDPRLVPTVDCDVGSRSDIESDGCSPGLGPVPVPVPAHGTVSDQGSHILSQDLRSNDSPSSQRRQNPHVHAYAHANLHAHAHSHDRRQRHEHHHLRQELVPAEPPVDPPADAPLPLVTQVVQTVSLIQIVNSLGSPIEIQTLYAEPATILLDPVSGNTVVISDQAPPGATASGSDPGAGDDAPAPGATDTPLSTAQTTTSASSSTSSTTPSPPPSSSSSTLSSSSASLTSSGPIPTDTAHTSLGGPLLNSTAPLGNVTYVSGTPMYYTQSSSRKSSFSSASFDRTRTSLIDTISSTISAGTSTYTEINGGGGGNGGGGNGGGNGGSNGGGGGSPPSGGSPDSSDSGGSGGSSDLTPQEVQVIGGVVGAVAGAALLVFLLLAALRYKRRRDAKPDHDDSTTTRGAITGGGGPDGEAMAERTAVPAAVAAAMASLTGKRRAPPPPPESAGPSSSGQTGFYRVSGRKLPSVLTAGGDGYTDPRESATSGMTDYYRGSQAFEPISGPSTRLALGSPMRPTSGVPVMRSGPGRTPVAETSDPFADPFSEPPSPPPVHDPLGRSLARHDGSGSGSRFREDI